MKVPRNTRAELLGESHGAERICGIFDEPENSSKCKDVEKHIICSDSPDILHKRAKARTSMSGDSSSSGPSFWKDTIDGHFLSVHSAKYKVLCESIPGDYTCHLKGLGGKEIDKSRRMLSTLDSQAGGSDHRGPG
ncbi:hypothetical protein BO79DRAFT_215617 [Aspergillus costaricaensis CBS 115574]|uniref:Uncharacterized protein n=1 Tax=Aspergillus costaricaensis CBS 115574 TaxID=1448317 RepID=A0ACD1IKW8_9EURO|nr:hypothetical protein BO79DRAFT_215617 [Aspergillus costaricaensis CBS 115574]RAK91263.1 hypothetical protein BO79DRAFT_215617 [Aspergillus costaricaensis CBS 115574]